jgi:hypothetical protein
MLQNVIGMKGGLPFNDALNCYLQHKAEYVAALQEAVARAVKIVEREEPPLIQELMKRAFVDEFRSGYFEKTHFAQYGNRVVATALMQRVTVVDGVLCAAHLISYNTVYPF